jgi:hypothetical protein
MLSWVDLSTPWSPLPSGVTCHPPRVRRYNDFYMTLFNVVFTVLTPFVIGVFDRDVDKSMALRFPWLYKQGACVLSGHGTCVV